MLGDKLSDADIRHRIDTAIDAFLHGFARRGRVDARDST
jgi:hypothetical protein